MNNKDVMKFIDSNFPPYNKCTIIEEKREKTIAILDYGKNDKLRVTVGIENGDYSLYKLLQTDFI